MVLHKGATTCFGSNLRITGKVMRMNVVVPSQTPSIPLAAVCGTLTLRQSRESHYPPLSPWPHPYPCTETMCYCITFSFFYADDNLWTLGQSAEFSHHYLCSKESEQGVERCDCLFCRQPLCNCGDDGGGGNEREQVCCSVPPCMLQSASARFYAGAVATLTTSTLSMFFSVVCGSSTPFPLTLLVFWQLVEQPHLKANGNQHASISTYHFCYSFDPVHSSFHWIKCATAAYFCFVMGIMPEEVMSLCQSREEICTDVSCILCLA